MLVFTQFREVTAPLAAFLARCSAGPGSCCTARPPVKKRQALVRAVPGGRGGAVLRALAQGRRHRAQPHRRVARRSTSTAGGTRRSRTRRPIARSASARRKNVLVHKFVCRGTVEEKIDELIESKRQLSQRAARRRRRAAADRAERRRAAEARRARSSTPRSKESDAWLLLRLEAVRPGGRAPAPGRARAGEARGRRASRSRRSSSRAARSPRRSGARPGATTSSATATSRTACRAGAPTCATARWSICRSRPARSTALVSGSELYRVAVQVGAGAEGALARHLHATARARSTRWSSCCRDASPRA